MGAFWDALRCDSGQSSMSFKGSERVTLAKISSQECEGPYFIVRFDRKAQHSCATCVDEQEIQSFGGDGLANVAFSSRRIIHLFGSTAAYPCKIGASVGALGRNVIVPIRGNPNDRPISPPSKPHKFPLPSPLHLEGGVANLRFISVEDPTVANRRPGHAYLTFSRPIRVVLLEIRVGLVECIKKPHPMDSRLWISFQSV
eukprot:scaffold416_cov329-Pavlova_lutheri.AAC.34